MIASLTNAWVKISKKTILEDINLQVKAGEFLILMGQSGSGKSTLLRVLGGLLQPTQGNLKIEGRVSMVFQHHALLPFRTAFENVAFGLEIKNTSKETMREKVEHALNLVGLEGRGALYPKELSGGMQQRVGLARALAVDSDIILMDEPFSALDSTTRCTLQNELLKLKDLLRKTIVFVTHDDQEAKKLGSRIIYMKEGKLVTKPSSYFRSY